jgi:lipopolysaccharide heptosyltransferase II
MVRTSGRPCSPHWETWQASRRLLCVRLDQLGDVVMTSAALRALKESIPQCRLTLLTSPSGAEAARLMPFVDEVLVYEAPWMKAARSSHGGVVDRKFLDDLRRASFDAAVIFTCYSQNPLAAALMCYLADIPLRLAHCHENPYHLLTDWVCDPEPDQHIRHETRRQLDLVGYVGAQTSDERLSLAVPSTAREHVDRLLDQRLDDVRASWVVIHPGASAPSRRYPLECYAAVARQLHQDMHCEIVFTGTEAECDLIEAIRTEAGVRSHSVAGELNVGQLAALLERAPLLIANNTGVVHVAAAVGTPVVDLYALTNPQHIPWLVPHRVLFHDVPCKFCYKSICPERHHDCLRLVNPTSVVQAAKELLTGERPAIQRRGDQLVHARH